MDSNNLGHKKIENAIHNSISNSNTVVPAEVANHFNWGAFTLSWIWGLGNKTYITLLSLALSFIPSTGAILFFIVDFIFGLNGNKWAWQNKKWESVEHFHEVQKKWASWGIALMLIPKFAVVMAILLGFAHAH